MKQSRPLPALLAAACLALAAPLPGVEPQIAFKEKPFAQLSDRELSEWGAFALGLGGAKQWQHGETEHFVIHFSRSGEKIARRSELFYDEIKEFFGNRPDLLRGRRSQVFAFSEAAEWAQFKKQIDLPWIGGITRGNEFYYLATGEEGRFDSKGRVQAHEMTHLIFNRFFRGRPPLWLNEGIAEYFGERKTSTVVEFRRMMAQQPKFPIEQLLVAEAYPKNEEALRSFYAESAIAVDFLTRSADSRALLPKFVDAMIANNDMDVGVRVYGYKNLAEFRAAYERYRHRF